MSTCSFIPFRPSTMPASDLGLIMNEVRGDWFTTSPRKLVRLTHPREYKVAGLEQAMHEYEGRKKEVDGDRS